MNHFLLFRKVHVNKSTSISFVVINCAEEKDKKVNEISSELNLLTSKYFLTHLFTRSSGWL